MHSIGASIQGEKGLGKNYKGYISTSYDAVNLFLIYLVVIKLGLKGRLAAF